MDGADHVSRSWMLIGRLRACNLKNGQPAFIHVVGSDGHDSHGVDGLGFPQEYFFLMPACPPPVCTSRGSQLHARLVLPSIKFPK
jgi:hypothetical protein